MSTWGVGQRPSIKAHLRFGHLRSFAPAESGTDVPNGLSVVKTGSMTPSLKKWETFITNHDVLKKGTTDGSEAIKGSKIQEQSFCVGVGKRHT